MAQSVKLMNIEWAKDSNAVQSILLTLARTLRVLWVSRHFSPEMRRPECELM
jgi:hypothetical protein